MCLANKISIDYVASSINLLATLLTVLELPLYYATYLDFVYEFDEVLTQPEVLWTMDVM